MPRHFSRGRRSRRMIIPLEEVESPPRVTHLHLHVPSALRKNDDRDNRSKATEISRLRTRLLRLILDNESARRIMKSPG